MLSETPEETTLVETLKSVDPDRYRAAVFADKAGRARLLRLYAFHYELAKVPELVSDPMAGRIRYQWWREAVDEMYSSNMAESPDLESGRKIVRAHEVTTPLAAMFRERDIPRFWVDKLIDGRERDLDPRPFATLNEAQDYARQTSGTLAQIAARCLGDMPSDMSDESVRLVGEAWGLTGLARAWRYYQDGMLSQLKFGDICGAMEEVYSAVQTVQDGELFPASTFPALAYGALIKGYARRLTSTRHDPATMSVDYSPLSKQVRLIGSVMTGRI